MTLMCLVQLHASSETGLGSPRTFWVDSANFEHEFEISVLAVMKQVQHWMDVSRCKPSEER